MSEKAIKFTLLLNIAMYSIIFIAPIAKAEQKHIWITESKYQQKDLIILLEKISGNLGSDIADMGNYTKCG